MDREKASLSLAGQLLQDMGAKSDPITAENVNAFRMRPTGPIIPERCVSVERFRLHGEITFIAVDPYGERWVASEDSHGISLHHSTDAYRINDGITLHEEDAGWRKTELVGFFHTEAFGYWPIVRIEYRLTGPVSEPGAWPLPSYWMDDWRVLTNVEGCIHALVQTHAGFILSVSHQRRHMLLHVTKLVDGKVILVRRTDSPYTQLAFDPNTKSVYGVRIIRLQTEHEALQFNVEHVATGNVLDEDSQWPQRLLSNSEGVWVSKYVNGGHHNLRKLTPKGLGEGTVLRNASAGVALMGEIPVAKIVRRHGQYSWRFCQAWKVLLKDPTVPKTEPAFDILSEPFQKGDGWFYYGLAGDHLCLMEVPMQTDFVAIERVGEV